MATQWTSTNHEWIKKVFYRCKANINDDNTTDVIIHYNDNDPAIVYCTRPLEVCAEFYKNEHFHVKLHKTTEDPAQPPQDGSRYESVRLVNEKVFERQSSSSEFVTWVYKSSISWENRCLRDVYTISDPVYNVTIMLNFRNRITEQAMKHWLIDSIIAKLDPLVGKLEYSSKSLEMEKVSLGSEDDMFCQDEDQISEGENDVNDTEFDANEYEE